MSVRVLLQTTIPHTKDDWSIERFSLLQNVLSTLRTDSGEDVVVTARDRAQRGGDDPVLSQLDASDFDELWLFAVDSGDGLGTGDCRGISAFARRGGGLLVSRDHQDLGCSICALERVGAAQYFHTFNPGPSAMFRHRDDVETPAIDWPNYHSGRNGDFQRITPTAPIHTLLRNPARPSGVVELFPAHPHEGAVGAPAADPNARVIATGVSSTTGATFNLAVAFEAHGLVLVEQTEPAPCKANVSRESSKEGMPSSILRSNLASPRDQPTPAMPDPPCVEYTSDSNGEMSTPAQTSHAWSSTLQAAWRRQGPGDPGPPPQRNHANARRPHRSRRSGLPSPLRTRILGDGLTSTTFTSRTGRPSRDTGHSPAVLASASPQRWRFLWGDGGGRPAFSGATSVDENQRTRFLDRRGFKSIKVHAARQPFAAIASSIPGNAILSRFANP